MVVLSDKAALDVALPVGVQWESQYPGPEMLQKEMTTAGLNSDLL